MSSKILYGPVSPDMFNGRFLYAEEFGFVETKPSGPARSPSGALLSPNVQVTFQDLEPPEIVELAGTAWACEPGSGKSLRDPVTAVYLVERAMQHVPSPGEH